MDRARRLAALVSVIFSFLTVFGMMQEAERWFPLANVWAVDSTRVVMPSNAPDAAWLSQAVHRVAQTHQADVMMVSPDPKDPARGRIIYLVDSPNGDPAPWSAPEYQDFSRARHTTIRPWPERPEAADRAALSVGSAAILVRGDEAAAWDLQSQLNDVGIASEVARGAGLYGLWHHYATSPAAQMFCLALLLVMLLRVQSPLAGDNAFGVRCLLGHRAWQVFVSEQIRWLRSLLVTAAVGAVAATAFLLWYNGGRLLATYLTACAGLLLMFALVASLAFGMGLLLAMRADVGAALKGRRGAGSVLSLGYATRLMATAVTISALAALIGAAQFLDDARFAQDATQRTPDYVRVGIRDAPEDDAANVALLARELSTAERSGQLIVSLRDSPQNFLAVPRDSAVPDYLHRDIFTVNSTYLKFHEILDQNGVPINPDNLDPNRVTLIAPSSIAGQLPELRAPAESYVSRFVTARETLALNVVTARPGQRVFSYANLDDSRPSSAMDPLVVVVPSAVAEWGTHLVWTASTGAVVMQRAALENTLRAQPPLADIVNAQFSVVQDADTRLGLASADLHTALFVVVLAAFVVLVSAAGAGVVYTRRHEARLFVQQIAGRDYLERHSLLVGVEILLVVSGLAWAAWRAELARGVQAPGMPSVFGLVMPAAAVVLIAAALIAAATVRGLDSRLVDERCAEA